MFLGHFGVAFGARAFAPKTSLGTLFFAAQFVDLLWPTLLLLGVERVSIEPGATAVVPLNFVHYPVSHSLLAVAGWALALAALYQWRRHYFRGSLAIGILVISHWLLDALVHRPDLPLYPGGAYRAGLDLWASRWGTLSVELLIFAAGVALYVRTVGAGAAGNNARLWALIIFLAGIYFANIFGPPPPSVAAIAWLGQAQWLLVLWAYWADRRGKTEARIAPASA